MEQFYDNLSHNLWTATVISRFFFIDYVFYATSLVVHLLRKNLALKPFHNFQMWMFQLKTLKMQSPDDLDEYLDNDEDLPKIGNKLFVIGNKLLLSIIVI